MQGARASDILVFQNIQVSAPERRNVRNVASEDKQYCVLCYNDVTRSKSQIIENSTVYWSIVRGPMTGDFPGTGQ